MNTKRVLITPLDWGLGHATRCIPIIRIFLARGFEVIIAGSGHSLGLLQQEFPQVKTFTLPAYNPSYASGSMVWQMARQLLKFIRAIRNEHKNLQQLIVDEKIDMVISDNRYGCWSSKVPSFFITHQTNIIMPAGWKWMSSIVNYFNTRQINKFKACLIPDTEEHLLSGILSCNSAIRANYTGPLSRFSETIESSIKYDVLILLSGPEPQRSLLEEIILQQLHDANKKVLVVRGVVGNNTIKVTESFEVVDFLGSRELQQAIQESALVISRSGYSTIMDLFRLGKRAIFIPTPGQTEQEYLAQRMKDQSIAYFMPQNNFNLHYALTEAEKYLGFVRDEDSYSDALLLEIVKDL
ncbi:MAG TPA: glycosyltransferase [Cyclobacteriaceae bacterium]|nr:glycosyltransferase [Cyclobacteriaceae bacterium]